MTRSRLTATLYAGLLASGLCASIAAAAPAGADTRCEPQIICYATCVYGKTNGFADERVRSHERREYKQAAKKADEICAAQCSDEPGGRTAEVRQACADESYRALLRGEIRLVD
ncbi:hypothetical protein IMCC20628_02136 [Hoeflea sp. IMCC20628]|uniref:hypothetical protein n=1 Tax=Hoeflea sp. IMCC20628 TaxID=1620421 RepID=UPI00063AF438|nr:hypothetical protein [Hoeflea sp. IMCC20628]AKI00840.1 hypothetical protein IMCC20628_02136 [Hoeflea sp. IMCC20628]